MDYIHKSAIEVIEFVKSKGIEIRFSSEDSFRSDLVDLLGIYRAVDKIGVNRVVCGPQTSELRLDLSIMC
jgi:homocitrate synthase